MGMIKSRGHGRGGCILFLVELVFRFTRKIAESEWHILYIRSFENFFNIYLIMSLVSHISRVGIVLGTGHIKLVPVHKTKYLTPENYFLLLLVVSLVLND